MRLIFVLSMLCVGFAGKICAEDSVDVVTMSPADMRTAVTSRSIEGFVAWEPFCAELVVTGQGHYLAKSSEVWRDHPCCMLATVIPDNDVKAALEWVHLKAMDFMKDIRNKEKVILYAMDFTGKSREVVTLALENIDYVVMPDMKGVKEYVALLNKEGFFSSAFSLKDAEGYLSKLFDKAYFDSVRDKYHAGWQPLKIPKKVRIGYLTADLHHLAGYIARQEGYFSRIFEDVEWFVFKNGPAVMSAFKSNGLDAAYLGVAPLLMKSINEQISIRIIAGVNTNGSGIMTRKSDDSIKSLYGKSIATPGFGTVQDFILRMYGQRNDFRLRLKK